MFDPRASSAETLHEYDFELTPSPTNDYDAVILAVSHSEFLEQEEDYFQNFCKSGIFIDIKGVYRNKINKLTYWSL